MVCVLCCRKLAPDRVNSQKLLDMLDAEVENKVYLALLQHIGDVHIVASRTSQKLVYDSDMTTFAGVAAHAKLWASLLLDLLKISKVIKPKVAQKAMQQFLVLHKLKAMDCVKEAQAIKIMMSFVGRVNRNVKDGTRTQAWMQELCLAYQAASGFDELGGKQADVLPIANESQPSTSKSAPPLPRFLEKTKMAGHRRTSTGSFSSGGCVSTPSKPADEHERLLALYGLDPGSVPRGNKIMTVVAVADSSDSGDDQQEAYIQECADAFLVASQDGGKEALENGKVFHDFANGVLMKQHINGRQEKGIEYLKPDHAFKWFRFEDGSEHCSEFPVLTAAVLEASSSMRKRPAGAQPRKTAGAKQKKCTRQNKDQEAEPDNDQDDQEDSKAEDHKTEVEDEVEDVPETVPKKKRVEKAVTPAQVNPVEYLTMFYKNSCSIGIRSFVLGGSMFFIVYDNFTYLVLFFIL